MNGVQFEYATQSEGRQFKAEKLLAHFILMENSYKNVNLAVLIPNFCRPILFYYSLRLTTLVCNLTKIFYTCRKKVLF